MIRLSSEEIVFIFDSSHPKVSSFRVFCKVGMVGMVDIIGMIGMIGKVGIVGMLGNSVCVCSLVLEQI